MATVSTSQGEENLTVHGPTSVGWDATVPPNEAVNHLGESVGENAIPWGAGLGRSVEVEGRVGIAAYLDDGPTQEGADPLARTARRHPDDAEVCRLREELRERNGLPDVEICEPTELDRIERIFRRDGVSLPAARAVSTGTNGVGVHSLWWCATCSRPSSSRPGGRVARACSRRSCPPRASAARTAARAST